jgi:hypothetical protein
MHWLSSEKNRTRHRVTSLWTCSTCFLQDNLLRSVEVLLPKTVRFQVSRSSFYVRNAPEFEAWVLPSEDGCAS